MEDHESGDEESRHKSESREKRYGHKSEADSRHYENANIVFSETFETGLKTVAQREENVFRLVAEIFRKPLTKQSHSERKDNQRKQQTYGQGEYFYHRHKPWSQIDQTDKYPYIRKTYHYRKHKPENEVLPQRVYESVCKSGVKSGRHFLVKDFSDGEHRQEQQKSRNNQGQYQKQHSRVYQSGVFFSEFDKEV